MKKIIVIIIIVICFAAIGIGCTSNDNKKHNQSKTSTQTISEQSDIKPLGTLATPNTGRIVVGINNYKGIVGNELNVIPELSGSGNPIGAYGMIYYDSNNLSNETLVKFYNDVVVKSKCNYVLLIDTQNPNKGISISNDGTLSKGTLDRTNGDMISKTSKLAIIDSNSKTFTWQNA